MKDFIRLLRIVMIRFMARISGKSLVNKGTTLIIAPHPDDEVLGCAGLIEQCVQSNLDVYVCILTGGEASHKGCCNISQDTLKAERRKLARTINLELGLPEENLLLLNFSDGQISSQSPEVSTLRSVIKRINAARIYIPHQKGEGWSDHIEAGNIVKELIKDTTIQLYEYCVWFWFYNVWKLDWDNAYLIRMNGEEHQRKLKAIHDYVTPAAPCGNPYSGVLPKVFIKGSMWKNELYFKVK